MEPKSLEYEQVIMQLLDEAARRDHQARGRIDRLWDAIAHAPIADDLHPLEQLTAVLQMLDRTGNSMHSIPIQEIARNVGCTRTLVIEHGRTE